MEISKAPVSLGFWIAVICTTLATTPFELQSENFALTTIVPFSLMFVLFFYIENSAKRIPNIKGIIWPVLVFVIIIVSNIQSLTNYAIALSILAPGVIILAQCARRSERTLFVIDKVITLNLVVFFIQLGVYSVSDHLVEFHKLLFPFSTSRVGEFIGLVRLGGLHNEPGTYSAFMFSLLVARHLLGAPPSDRIFTLTGLSIFFTFSAWGMLAACIVFFVALISKDYQRRWSKVIILAGLSLLVAVVSSSEYINLIGNYVDQRFDVSKGSASYRSEALTVFIHDLPDYTFIGRPFAEEFCWQCIAPQDLGVFSQLIVRLGLLSGLVIILFSLRPFLLKSFPTAILLVFFFSGKYDLGDPIFWFVLGLAVSARAMLEKEQREVRMTREGGL